MYDRRFRLCFNQFAVRLFRELEPFRFDSVLNNFNQHIAASISEFHLRGWANVRNGGARAGGNVTVLHRNCLSFWIYEISCLWKIRIFWRDRLHKTEKAQILHNSVEFCKICVFSTTKKPAETGASAGCIIRHNDRGYGIIVSYRFRGSQPCRRRAADSNCVRMAPG